MQNSNLVDVTFEYVPVINFSMQQNHVPIVRKLVVKNSSDIDLRHLTIEITAEPDFALLWTTKLDLLPGRDDFDLHGQQQFITALK